MIIHPPDDELAERAGRGDRAAFDLLVGRYDLRMRGFIRLRVERDADVGDIAQKAWLRVWGRMPTYDRSRQTPFWAFALPSARYALRQYYRRRRTIDIHETSFSDLVGEDSDIDTAPEFPDALTPVEVDRDSDVEPTVYEELLRVTFGGTSPPHQLLAFGWSKLIAKWPPRRIVEKLSDTVLRKLATELEHAYLEESSLPAACAKPCFAPLHRQMPRKFEKAITESRTLTSYPQLHGRVVGTTVLRDYYGDDPEQNISHWSGAVQRRVLKEVEKSAHSETCCDSGEVVNEAPPVGRKRAKRRTSRREC